MEPQAALLELFAVAFLLLCPSCMATCEDEQTRFLVEPSSVTAVLNTTATFHFTAIGAASEWKINGLFDNHPTYENRISNTDNNSPENCILRSILTVPATADFNNSEIECIIVGSSGVVKKFVTLTIVNNQEQISSPSITTRDVKKITANTTTDLSSVIITCSFAKGSPALGSLIMLTSVEGSKEELIKIALRAKVGGFLSPTASVLFSNLQPGTYKVSVFDVKKDGHVNISMPYYYDLNVTVADKEVTTSTPMGTQEVSGVTTTETNYLVPAIVGATIGSIGCCLIVQICIIFWMWCKLKTRPRADHIGHIPIIVKEPAYEELKPKLKAVPNLEQIYEEVPKAGLKEMDHISPAPCPAYETSRPRRRSITVI